MCIAQIATCISNAVACRLFETERNSAYYPIRGNPESVTLLACNSSSSSSSSRVPAGAKLQALVSKVWTMHKREHDQALER